MRTRPAVPAGGIRTMVAVREAPGALCRERAVLTRQGAQRAVEEQCAAQGEEQEQERALQPGAVLKEVEAGAVQPQVEGGHMDQCRAQETGEQQEREVGEGRTQATTANQARQALGKPGSLPGWRWRRRVDALWAACMGAVSRIGEAGSVRSEEWR